MEQQQQCSSLPSSRRPSTIFAPSQILANNLNSARLYIRVPVKDVEIQVDMASEQTKKVNVSTQTDFPLTLSQLTPNDQQLLFKQAIEYVLMGIQNQKDVNMAGEMSNVKQARSISIDHGQFNKFIQNTQQNCFWPDSFLSNVINGSAEITDVKVRNLKFNLNLDFNLSFF